MGNIKSMVETQWKIVEELQIALDNATAKLEAPDGQKESYELSRALESSMNVWRMLKDLSP